MRTTAEAALRSQTAHVYYYMHTEMSTTTEFALRAVPMSLKIYEAFEFANGLRTP